MSARGEAARAPVAPADAGHPPARARDRRAPAAAAAIVALGVGLRAGAARGDLWLDELWSLLLTPAQRSLVGVFTRIHLDNNHHLNTLWLLVWGNLAPPITQRLLSILCSGAMIALLAWAPLRGGRLEGLITAGLAATSFLLVQYGSEARGYGPALAFSVASFVALDRWLATRRLRWAAAFAAAATLVILSHLLALFALGAMAGWALAELWRTRRTRPPRLGHLAVLAIPVAVLVGLWAIDLRFMGIGGAGEYPFPWLLRDLARAHFGLPRGRAELAGAALLLVAASEIVRLAVGRDARAVFFLLLLAIPAAVLAVYRPPVLQPRHLLFVAPFVLMLLGSALARLAARGSWGRVAVAALAVGLAVSNASAIVPLVRYGRGGYREALALILRESHGAVATIGSDHDFRNSVVLFEAERRLKAYHDVEYVRGDAAGARAPEWFIRHDFSEQPRAPRFVVERGRTYELRGVFPYAGMSGWSWLVYRLWRPPPARSR